MGKLFPLACLSFGMIFDLPIKMYMSTVVKRLIEIKTLMLNGPPHE